MDSKIDWLKCAKLALLLLIVSGAGFIVGRQTKQQEVKVVTETVIQERIVEKQVQVSDKSRKSVTIKKPDGTIITSVTQKDISVLDQQKQTDTKIEQKREVVLNPTKLPNYSLGIQAKFPFAWPIGKPEYTVTAGYRLIGPLWVEGLYQISPKMFGVGIRLEH